MNNYKQRVAWMYNTNIYEVNVRQYTDEGTFNAFSHSLPRLKDMGVKVLWFMPITPIAKKEMKGTMGSYYACSDYTAINPEFGTLDDFRNLVRLAHEMDFKVIIDWVANHTGWDHRWTVEHPGFYNIDEHTKDFKRASGMDDIIELNYDNPELVATMIDAMKFWVNECDIDGFRCDLADWVALHFWQKARPQLDALKPLFWLGEFDELDNPDYGQVFDVSYSWRWMHKTKDFYQQQLPLNVLDSLLWQYSLLGDHSMRAWYTSNHDENSWNGTEYEKYGDMAKALAVFSATWNGVPLVYSGQELPLTDKRLMFFDKDSIPWTNEYHLHSFYKTLLNLHSDHPALRGGDAEVVTYILKTSESDKIFAYQRKNGDRELLVLLNMSNQKNIEFGLTQANVQGLFYDAFSDRTYNISENTNFELDAWGWLLLTK